LTIIAGKGNKVGRFNTCPKAEAIPHYIKQYPEMQISLKLADRFVDVVTEGFDLVIRIAELEDTSLIARKIASCKRVFCAAPEYLNKRVPPAFHRIWLITTA